MFLLIKNIILQPSLFNDIEDNPPPKRKRSSRSLKGMADQPLPVHVTGKRYGPSP